MFVKFKWLSISFRSLVLHLALLAALGRPGWSASNFFLSVVHVLSWSCSNSHKGLTWNYSIQILSIKSKQHCVPIPGLRGMEFHIDKLVLWSLVYRQLSDLCKRQRQPSRHLDSKMEKCKMSTAIQPYIESNWSQFPFFNMANFPSLQCPCQEADHFLQLTGSFRTFGCWESGNFTAKAWEMRELHGIGKRLNKELTIHWNVSKLCFLKMLVIL